MISQPTQEQINIENIKNQITLGEGELLRLKGLQESENYGISELVKEKKYQEELVDGLHAEKVILEKEIDSLQTEKEDALRTINEANSVKSIHEDRVAKLGEEKKNHQARVNSDLSDLQSREDKLSEKETLHLKSKEEVAKREVSVKLREDKIAAFVVDLEK